MQQSETVKANARDVLAWMRDWFYEKLNLDGAEGFVVLPGSQDNKILHTLIRFDEPIIDWESLELTIKGIQTLQLVDLETPASESPTGEIFRFKLYPLGENRAEIKRQDENLWPQFYLLLDPFWNEIRTKFETIPPVQPESPQETAQTAFEKTGIWELPVEWDVLAAASESCLDGFAGTASHEIIRQTPASVIFGLKTVDDGSDLGTVEIKKIRAGFSELHIRGIPLGAEKWPEWEKIHKNLHGQPSEVIRAALQEKDQKLRQRRDELKKIQNITIGAYFERLKQERIWLEKDQTTISKETKVFFTKNRLEGFGFATTGSVKDILNWLQNNRFVSGRRSWFFGETLTILDAERGNVNFSERFLASFRVSRITDNRSTIDITYDPEVKAQIGSLLSRMKEDFGAEWPNPLDVSPVGQADGLTPSTKLLPKIEDPTDQRIWAWLKDDPSLTDAQLAQRLKISRQAVNPRRKRLEAMGYPVRVSRQKK